MCRAPQRFDTVTITPQALCRMAAEAGKEQERLQLASAGIRRERKALVPCLAAILAGVFMFCVGLTAKCPPAFVIAGCMALVGLVVLFLTGGQDHVRK